MAKEIKMGWKVRDKVTGLEGIVNHTVLYVGQGPMIGMAPTKLDKDGKPADSHMFDVAQIEVVDEKPLFDIPKITPFKFDFGDEVKDIITGYQGKVAGLATYLNGCNRILVRAPYDKNLHKATIKDGEFLAEDSIVLVRKAKKEAKKVSKETPRTKGGPADFRSSFP